MRLRENCNPQEVLGYLKRTFDSDKIVLTTAFGLEGCMLIDICHQLDLRITIADIDTGNLFPESHSLRDELKARYPSLRFQCWYPELTLERQAELYGERLWERDPEKCCELRKVSPLDMHLPEFQVWITGIRRTQSSTRSEVQVVQWDCVNSMLKICPLANRSRQEVWEYIQQNDVPHNVLHYAGYPSIGCTHCTSFVPGVTSPGEYSRNGRWEKQEKTECGIHLRPQSSTGRHTPAKNATKKN